MNFAQNNNRRLVPKGCVVLPNSKVQTNSQNLPKNANSLLKTAAFQHSKNLKNPKTSFISHNEIVSHVRMPRKTIEPISHFLGGNSNNAVNNINDMNNAPLSLQSYLQVTQPCVRAVDSISTTRNRGPIPFQVISPNSLSKAKHVPEPKATEVSKTHFAGTIKSMEPNRFAVVSHKNAAYVRGQTVPTSVTLKKSAKNIEEDLTDSIKNITLDPNAMVANKTANISSNLEKNSSVLLEQHSKQTQIRKILPTKSIIAKPQNVINVGHDFKPKISSASKYVKNNIKKVTATAPLNVATNTNQNIGTGISDVRSKFAEKDSKTGIVINYIKSSKLVMPKTKRPINTESNKSVDNTDESTALSSKLANKPRTYHQCSRNTTKHALVKVNPLKKTQKILTESDQQSSTKSTFPASKSVLVPKSKNLQNFGAVRKAGGAAIPHQNINKTQRKNVERVASPLPKRIKRDAFNLRKSVIDGVIDSTPFAIVEPNVQPRIDQAKGTEKPQNFVNVENMLRAVVTQSSNLNSRSTKSFANSLKCWMESVKERNLKIEEKRSALVKLDELIDKKNQDFSEITKKIKHLNFSKSNASIDFENNYKCGAAILADTERLTQKYREILKSGYGFGLNWALTNENFKNDSSELQEDPLVEIVRICEAHGQTNAANVIRELAKGS